ncbi:hypothetical protein GCM10018952_75960 [Streptosporangium vulgare]
MSGTTGLHPPGVPRLPRLGGAGGVTGAERPRTLGTPPAPNRPADTRELPPGETSGKRSERKRLSRAEAHELL